MNTDYLTVEITSDGGQTWKKIDEFDNTNGEFDWKYANIISDNTLTVICSVYASALMETRPHTSTTGM